MVDTRYITVTLLLVLALLRVSVAQLPSFLMPPDIEDMLHAAMQGNPFTGGQNSMMPRPFDLGMPPPNVDQEMMRFLALSNHLNSGHNEAPRRGQRQGSRNQAFENNLFSSLLRSQHVSRPFQEMEPADMFMFMNMMNSKSHNSPFGHLGPSQNHNFEPEFEQPAFSSLFNSLQQPFPAQSQFQDHNQQVVTAPIPRPQLPGNMDTTTNPRFKGTQTMMARNNMNNAGARMPNGPSSDMTGVPGRDLNEPYNSQMGTNSHVDPYQSGQPSYQDFANIMNPGSSLGGLQNMPPGLLSGAPINPSDLLDIIENRMEEQLRTRQMQAMMAAFIKPQTRHNNHRNAVAAPASFVKQSPIMEPISVNTLQEPLIPSNIIETAMPNFQTQQQTSSGKTNMLATLSKNNRKQSVTSLGPKSPQIHGVDTGVAPANVPGVPGNVMSNDMMCMMCFNMIESGPCIQQFCSNP